MEVKVCADINFYVNAEFCVDVKLRVESKFLCKCQVLCAHQVLQKLSFEAEVKIYLEMAIKYTKVANFIQLDIIVMAKLLFCQQLSFKTNKSAVILF